MIMNDELGRVFTTKVIPILALCKLDNEIVDRERISKAILFTIVLD